VTALAFKTAVDDPRRFRRSRTVGAHFGLTPKRFQSGTIDCGGRITRCGDPEVRTALYEAANSLMVRSKKWSALLPGASDLLSGAGTSGRSSRSLGSWQRCCIGCGLTAPKSAGHERMDRTAATRRRSLRQHDDDRRSSASAEERRQLLTGSATADERPVVGPWAGVEGRNLTGPACRKPSERLAHPDSSFASMVPASGRARRNAWTTTERGCRSAREKAISHV
jgi:hypothetical protein